VKRRYLEEWALAVNAHGGFEHWRCAVAKAPGEIRDILIKSDATEEGD
jgi:type III restriction enzyme